MENKKYYFLNMFNPINDYILIKNIDFYFDYDSELYSFGFVEISYDEECTEGSYVYYKKYKEQNPLYDDIFQFSSEEILHNSHLEMQKKNDFIFIKKSQVIARINKIDHKYAHLFSKEREKPKHCCDEAPRGFGELRPGEILIARASSYQPLDPEERERRNDKAAATKAANKAKKLAESNW